MLRHLAFSASFALLTAAAAPAAAADLPYGNPYADNSVSSAVYDWTGGYVGGHLGYGWGSANSFDPSGVLGGVQGGYSMQQGQFVLGLEGDIGISGMEDSRGATDVSIDWLGSFRARAGFAFDQFLVYGTGGFGFGNVNYENAISRDDQWQLGWVLGAGVEAALTRNWTARVEAFYYDLGSGDYVVAGGPNSIDVTATVLRAGVNYRF